MVMRNRARTRAAKPVILVLSLIFGAVTGFPQAAAKKQTPPAKGGKEGQEKKKDEEERSKLFQLDNVVIDVVEYIRDIEVPNMGVVKTELFPMSIATTVDTALERQPGIDIQRIQEVGTAMDDDSIKIRGLGARRIQVRRDGRQLNSPGVAGGYFVDWTTIPLIDVDRVEVIKGVGDARYGNVLGGVVNLVPRKLPAD